MATPAEHISRNEDIRAARRVLDRFEEMARLVAELERREGLANFEIGRLKRDLAQGAIHDGGRSWTPRDVEEMRASWFRRGVLLEEAVDGFDFVEEYLPAMKPTARRALQQIKQKIKDELGS